MCQFIDNSVGGVVQMQYALKSLQSLLLLKFVDLLYV
uniref:Uncharacterized protein n=1 Tax=Rhizophora mucronata TaxID=61149 RepID=A0A2P2JGV3_RHIMU